MDASRPKVFISYRRDETPVRAGRLYDAMVARFGESHVFMDLQMEPGTKFEERITEVVSSCHVLLVMIGPRWATPTEEGEHASIHDPDDFVRLEVETALACDSVAVIPLLVAAAEMPEAEDLPAGLRPLTELHALELTEARWHHDVGLLTSRLEKLLRGTSAMYAVPPEMLAQQENGNGKPSSWYVAASLALVVVVFAAIGAGRRRAAHEGPWLSAQH